jgi:hypothetical protein
LGLPKFAPGRTQTLISNIAWRDPLDVLRAEVPLARDDGIEPRYALDVAFRIVPNQSLQVVAVSGTISDLFHKVNYICEQRGFDRAQMAERGFSEAVQPVN